MTDLISRHALVSAMRKERDAYFNDHFHQDPATGTYEASNAKEEYLEELDARIEQIEQFPSTEIAPIATLINNNQPGWTNIIETPPNITIDIGTKLYTQPTATGDLFNELLRRINFDGMDPRSFSLAELERAIPGAKWPTPAVSE